MQLQFNKEALTSLNKGITALSQALQEGYTLDENSLTSFEKVGYLFGKELMQQMEKSCKDGTKAALFILEQLVQFGTQEIEKGAHPGLLTTTLTNLSSAVIQELTYLSTPLESLEKTTQFAQKRANKQIGSIIAKAVQAVGPNGLFFLEGTQNQPSHVEIVKGLLLDCGYICPSFHEMQELVSFEEARILVTDKGVGSIQELLPILSALSESNQNLLIIADDVESKALSTLIFNRLHKTPRHVFAIKGSSLGDKIYLEEIALFTGATLLSSLSEATPDKLGICDKVELTREKTTLIAGRGVNRLIQERLSLIEKQLDQKPTAEETIILEKRRRMLTGDAAIIRVSGSSPFEIERAKLLYSKPLCATRQAMEQGIVPGGGAALVVACEAAFANQDSPAIQAVKRACQAPFKNLAQAAGYDFLTLSNQKFTNKTCFNLLTGELASIDELADPVIVPIKALELATTMAITILKSQAVILD